MAFSYGMNPGTFWNQNGGPIANNLYPSAYRTYQGIQSQVTPAQNRNNFEPAINFFEPRNDASRNFVNSSAEEQNYHSTRFMNAAERQSYPSARFVDRAECNWTENSRFHPYTQVTSAQNRNNFEPAINFFESRSDASRNFVNSSAEEQNYHSTRFMNAAERQSYPSTRFVDRVECSWTENSRFHPYTQVFSAQNENIFRPAVKYSETENYDSRRFTNSSALHSTEFMNAPERQNYPLARFVDRVGRNLIQNSRFHPYSQANNSETGNSGTRQDRATNASKRHSNNGLQCHSQNDEILSEKSSQKQKNQAVKKKQRNVKKQEQAKNVEILTGKKHGPETSKYTGQKCKKISEENEKENNNEQSNGKSKQEENIVKKFEYNEKKKQNEIKEKKKERAKCFDVGKKCGAEEQSKTGSSNVSKSSKKSLKPLKVLQVYNSYGNIPVNNIVCHICNKRFQRKNEFECHLTKRPHLLRMEHLEKSYEIKTGLMRKIIRSTEEQRELAAKSSKRHRKKNKFNLISREYCQICDLSFYKALSDHYKTDNHQELKAFLHPRCVPCKTQFFQSRIEYDKHCLTISHMASTTSSEELRKNEEKDEESVFSNTKDMLSKGESNVKSPEGMEKNIGIDMENTKVKTAADNYITDIPENPLLDKNAKVPPYNFCKEHHISLGESMVKKVEAYYCEKCEKFMLHEVDVAAHLRSVIHYQNFSKEIQELAEK